MDSLVRCCFVFGVFLGEEIAEYELTTPRAYTSTSGNSTHVLVTSHGNP